MDAAVELIFRRRFDEERKELIEQVTLLQSQIDELKSLLRETEYFHLRYEENREWLERRKAALK